MIEHLRGRHEPLAAFGWSEPEAEWVALVCLHSGLFTSVQYCAYFGGSGPAWVSQAARFMQSLIDRKLAVEEPLDGLPTTTRPCRIANKKIYRVLGIPNVRHRRSASSPVLLRRLVSLDYVLDHPGQGWLPTEDEKVNALEALKIPRSLFPRRDYSGRAAHVSRYFAIKLPLALDPGSATFVYADPGRDTDKELLTWGSMHAKLWAALRAQSRQVHVVAVARDHVRQQRAHQVLLRWTRPGPGPDFQPLTQQEQDNLARIEKAVKAVDLLVLGEYGGMDGAMQYRKLLMSRAGVQTAAPKNRIRIDQGKTWLSPRLPAEDEA